MPHVKEVLKDQHIDVYHCGVNSMTELYWIKGQGTWLNLCVIEPRLSRTRIERYSGIMFQPVTTSENPSNQGSQGVAPNIMGELWFQGPEWLSAQDRWPNQPEVSESPENEKERVKPKHEKQLLVKETEEANETRDTLLGKYASYWKLLRVTVFVKRFMNNCRKLKKQKGPLMTEELQAAEKFWIIQAQVTQASKSDVGSRKDEEEGVLRCVGRVPHHHPLFLPRNSKLATSIIQQVHEQMLHGGVSTTMCPMREKYWIPKLRLLTKKVIRNCIAQILFCQFSELNCQTLLLLQEWILLGLSTTRLRISTTSKAYIALFTCTSTHAVHLKLCRYLSAQEFQRALQEFVARRGCPQNIVSDNGKTFVATGKRYQS